MPLNQIDEYREAVAFIERAPHLGHSPVVAAALSVYATTPEASAATKFLRTREDLALFVRSLDVMDVAFDIGLVESGHEFIRRFGLGGGYGPDLAQIQTFELAVFAAVKRIVSEALDV